MKALLIGLVVAAGLLITAEAFAQDPPKPILAKPAVLPAGYAEPAPGGYAAPAPGGCDGCGSNGYYGAKTGGKHGIIHRCIDKFERHGCGYGKTHHDFGCLSVRAHWVFVFGNCQQFFEEPCYKQPEHRWFQK